MFGKSGRRADLIRIQIDARERCGFTTPPSFPNCEIWGPCCASSESGAVTALKKMRYPDSALKIVLTRLQDFFTVPPRAILELPTLAGPVVQLYSSDRSDLLGAPIFVCLNLKH